MKHFRVAGIIPMLCCGLVAPAGSSQTLQQKIAGTNWAKIRGVNFVPSYAANTYEIWRNYDHDAFDRDVRLAQAAGYSSVRLWLNYAAFEELGPKKMADRFQDAVRLCSKYKLKAVVNLFDSCGIRPRKDARWMPAPEAYDFFQASPRFTPSQKTMMQQLFGNYVRGYGKHTRVPVGADTPPMALLWQNWQPTPGNDRLTPEFYPKLEAYVDAMVGRLKNDPAILFWDLMNEPEFASEGPVSPGVLITPEMEKLRDAFLTHFHGFLKRKYLNEIVSIGWASLDNANRYASLADVLTFHVYAEPAPLQATIDKAVAIGKNAGKQILITETLANWDFGTPTFGRLATDEQQLAHYQKVLPVLMKSPIGWMAWGLVVPRDFNRFTDIFYSSGHPRPAAVFLEETLKGARQAR